MKSTKGFTIIELLTAIAVSALLLSLLLPSLTRVRNMAREAKQRVQFSSIDQALLAWRNDFGEYPQSFLYEVPDYYFCGAQKLAEALFGLDLLGFHPLSKFRPDGVDGDEALYYGTRRDPILLEEREGRYLELEAANAYRLEYSIPGAADGLLADSGMFYGASYVLCDEFARIPIRVGIENKKAGMPILYYRANTSNRTMRAAPEGRIYNENDNADFVNELFTLAGQEHPLLLDFEGFIEDPKATQLSDVPSFSWPYRPDSYILISAGLDGIYGTTDDITNFR